MALTVNFHYAINFFLRLLNPGDHIVVMDKEGSALASHHGIFIGYGEGFIHVAGRDLTVKKTDFYVFITKAVGDNNELWRVIYENSSPPEEVINRAKQSLENSSSFGSYSIFKNNCEHFATYCKTGVAISLQIIQKIRDCYVSPVKLFKTAYKSAEESSNKS